MRMRRNEKFQAQMYKSCKLNFSQQHCNAMYIAINQFYSSGKEK